MIQTCPIRDLRALPSSPFARVIGARVRHPIRISGSQDPTGNGSRSHHTRRTIRRPRSKSGGRQTGSWSRHAGSLCVYARAKGSGAPLEIGPVVEIVRDFRAYQLALGQLQRCTIPVASDEHCARPFGIRSMQAKQVRRALLLAQERADILTKVPKDQKAADVIFLCREGI
jgi:hypothetical protein